MIKIEAEELMLLETHGYTKTRGDKREQLWERPATNPDKKVKLLVQGEADPYIGVKIVYVYVGNPIRPIRCGSVSQALEHVSEQLVNPDPNNYKKGKKK